VADSWVLVLAVGGCPLARSNDTHTSPRRATDVGPELQRLPPAPGIRYAPTSSPAPVGTDQASVCRNHPRSHIGQCITRPELGWEAPDELGKTVEVYAAAFPDMHRELYDFWVDGNAVVVRLALQGTQTGPLASGFGVLPPTGNRIDAPCADIWEIDDDGKITKFDCYAEGTIIFAQLGILANIQAAFAPADNA